MRKKIRKAALAGAVVIGILSTILLGSCTQTQNREKQVVLRSTIAFVSTRHDPVADAAADRQRLYNAAEIYLMTPVVVPIVRRGPRAKGRWPNASDLSRARYVSRAQRFC